jgi:hypothetical protein
LSLSYILCLLYLNQQQKMTQKNDAKKMTQTMTHKK